VEDVCHPPPPTPHLSTHHHLPVPPIPALPLAASKLTLLLSPLLLFPLQPAPRPSSFCSSVSLCHLFLSLHCSPLSLPPSSPLFLLWMDRFFLFTTGNAVSALLTNQQEGISAASEMSRGACFSDCQPCQPVRRVCVCVYVCVCVCVCVCFTHGLLSSQTEGLF